MSRPPHITYDDVQRVCVRMLGEGELPSNQSIYDALGRRGSMSTIQKHKVSFFASLKQRGIDALPATIPADLYPVIEEMWLKAIQSAGEAHRDEKLGLIEQYEQQKAQTDRVNEDLVTVQGKLEQTASDLATATAALEQAEKEFEGKLALEQSLRDTIARLDEALEDLKEEHRSTLASIKKDHEAEVATKDDRIKSLGLELEAAIERERNEVLRAQRDADHFLLQIATERDRSTKTENTLQNTITRLESELTIIRARSDNQVERMEKMEQKNDGLLARLDDLNTELAEQRTSYQDALSDNAALRLENAELQVRLSALETTAPTAVADEHKGTDDDNNRT